MYDESEEMKKVKLQLSNAEYKIGKLEEENAWLKASRLIEKEAEKLGVGDKAMPDILDRARKSGEWVVKNGHAVRMKHGSVEYFPNGEDVTDKSFLRNIAPEAPHLFGQQENVKDGAAGPNPWVTKNLTQQGQLLKSNPSLAKQLAAAVGVKLVD
jgi:hypothetical protein